MNDKLEGIVIGVKDYREHDVILQVLTKDYGLQSLVARGLKKMNSKNAGVCQLFTQAYFYFNYHETSSIHTIRTADLIKSNRRLREDLLKQSIASIFCECIERTALDHEMVNWYAMLQGALDVLEKTEQPYAIAALFLSLINRSQGIEPFVDGCVLCGRSDHICSVSVQDGGFVCSRCFDETKHHLMTLEQLKCFRLVCHAKLEHTSILEKSSAWNYEHFELVYRFFEEYSGIRLKSVRFLNSLQNL